MQSNIKCIIFDLGGVLIEWDLPQIIQTLYGQDSSQANYLIQNLSANTEFKSLEVAYQKGLFTLSQMIFHTAQVLNISPHVAQVFFEQSEQFLRPIQSNIEILKSLSQYRLLILSNTSHNHIQFMKNNYHFFNVFERCYFSCELGMAKPDLEIFQYLQKDLDLDFSTCFFIDDTKENILAAKSLGLSVLHHPNGKDLTTSLKLTGLIS